jgi:hypothetical protein
MVWPCAWIHSPPSDFLHKWGSTHKMGVIIVGNVQDTSKCFSFKFYRVHEIMLNRLDFLLACICRTPHAPCNCEWFTNRQAPHFNTLALCHYCCFPLQRSLHMILTYIFIILNTYEWTLKAVNKQILLRIQISGSRGCLHIKRNSYFGWKVFPVAIVTDWQAWCFNRNSTLGSKLWFWKLRES